MEETPVSNKMLKKNKTVKELNADLEFLIVKVEKLEDNNLELQELKKKVKDLEELLQSSQERIKDLENIGNEDFDKNKSNKGANISKCEKCEQEFASNKILKDHIKKMHSQSKKCKFCEETFVKCSDLEEHLQNFHYDATQYECEDCGKKIVLEWRMKKHKILHEESASIKYCHYFNNKTVCPYEKIGCMFRHNQSRECKFGKQCHIKLCQFQHNSAEETEKETVH